MPGLLKGLHRARDGLSQLPMRVPGHCFLTTLLLIAIEFSEAAENRPSPLLSRTNLMEFVDGQGRIQPVRSGRDWQLRRQSILNAMQEVMGPLPGPSKRCPLDVVVLEEVDCGTYVRRCITYTSEPGSQVPAYLLIPKQALTGETLAAGVLCLHQTHRLGQEVVIGQGNSPNDEYGLELVQRGYVCLVPAYPLLANYHPDLKALGYQSGTMKAIWDNIRGLDLLESLPFIRKGGFGAIGHSLGGHNSVYTAAFDKRIKVVISSCGLDSYRDYMGGNIRGWTSDRYMPRLLEYPLTEIPFDFHEIIGTLAPRICFVSAPVGDTNFHWWSAGEVINAASAVYDLFQTPGNLRVEHPECGHVFPREMRELAYELFAQEL